MESFCQAAAHADGAVARNWRSSACADVEAIVPGCHTAEVRQVEVLITVVLGHGSGRKRSQVILLVCRVVDQQQGSGSSEPSFQGDPRLSDLRIAVLRRRRPRSDLRPEGSWRQ